MTASLTLRTKWTGALLAVGVVPVALFGYATIEIQRRGLESAEQQIEVAVTDHVASVLDRTLDDAAEGAHRVGRLLTEPHVTDDDARLALAREGMARAEALTQVAIYSPDGALIDAIARKDSRAVAPPPHLPVPPSGEAAWLPIAYGPAGAVVRYAEPVIRDGERRAWVMGTVDAGVLSGALRSISRDRFENRDDGLLLLDDTAHIVASSGGGEGLSEGASLLGVDILHGQTLPKDPFARPFAIATEFREPGGEAMVGSVRSLPALRWAIVVRRPRETAYGALVTARRLLGGTAALFALAAVALGAWLAAKTTRPVRQLVELTRAYGRRAFDVRSQVHTGDELEELGASMTDMADHLAASDREITRRAGVETNLSRYLPAEVAKAIAEGKQELALGGERREVTVLFADVVAFTKFAEMAPPERAVSLLNELFSVLTEVVFRHGGTVDKFMGDCIMAVFGAPSATPDHAARALAAAEDMHRFVESNAPAWLDAYGADVKLGIGVNSGPALVGNLGSEQRMEYTAIGDVVNVASRLEGLARPGQTLLTAEVATAAGDAFVTRSLGDQPLRGKRQSVSVYELR